MALTYITCATYRHYAVRVTDDPKAEVRIKEAARIAGVSESTLRRYQELGRIAPVRLIGARGDRVFRVGDLLRIRAEDEERARKATGADL